MRRNNVPCLDESEELNALGPSFYHMGNPGDYGHMTVQGHQWLGFVLANRLIDDKLIPFPVVGTEEEKPAKIPTPISP
jgi:hypothetical protein